MDKKLKQRIIDYLKQTGSNWMPASEIKMNFEEALHKKELVSRSKNGIQYVTLASVAKKEHLVAQALYSRSLTKTDYNAHTVDQLIKEFEMQESVSNSIDFHFGEEQKKAIHLLAANHVGILTGGPGTGKTSVIKCLSYVLSHIIDCKKCFIHYTAPTGKAARRITESTGFETSTLQKYTGGYGKSGIENHAPHVFFCDEFSMCDLTTISYLMISLQPRSRIYFIGDTDQLLSVGIGALLRDIVLSNTIPVATLTQTYRQKGDSEILDNILMIKDGDIEQLREGEAFKLIQPTETILDDVLELYSKGREKYGNENVVLLTPTRQIGKMCSNRLNEVLQEKLNPLSEGKPHVEYIKYDNGTKRTISFRVGDPVMQTQNLDKVVNGEVGEIIDISDGYVKVQYVDRALRYSEEKLFNLDLAYALSVYKSQGSEYPFVIMLALTEHQNMNRNLLYTGISRAKKECVLFSDKITLDTAVKKVASFQRITFLMDELQAQKESWEIKLSMVNASVHY